MKILTLVFISAMLLFAQNNPPAKQQPQNLPAAQTARPQSVPKDAVEIEPYLFRSTDAQGKHWLYRQTPFGVSKWEEQPAPQAGTNSNPVRVTDLGDRFRFDYATPFGKGNWIHKKTELTEYDKEMLKLDAANHTAFPEPAGKSDPVAAGRR